MEIESRHIHDLGELIESAKDYLAKYQLEATLIHKIQIWFYVNATKLQKLSEDKVMYH